MGYRLSGLQVTLNLKPKALSASMPKVPTTVSFTAAPWPKLFFGLFDVMKLVGLLCKGCLIYWFSGSPLEVQFIFGEHREPIQPRLVSAMYTRAAG